MLQRFSLRVRIYIILALCVYHADGRFCSGLVHVSNARTAYRNYRKRPGRFSEAEALETALINQKGFVSYYFMDGDPDWLRQLGEYRQIFKERLDEARENAPAKMSATKP